jgi:hypothetical protein
VVAPAAVRGSGEAWLAVAVAVAGSWLVDEAPEPHPEFAAGPVEAAPDRPDRPAQLRGRLLLGQALEQAEHDGGAVSLGEPAEFLVDRRAEVLPPAGVLGL